MSLIFDGFPDRADAEAFVNAVRADEPELATHIFDTREDADAADPFPFELTPPIVHVERPYSGDDSGIETAREQGYAADDAMTGAEREAELEQLVEGFGGRYAGT